MFGVLLLLACGRQDTAADNAVAIPDELAGDVAASVGLRWTYQAADRAALFGPPSSPAFSIQCNRQREGDNQLVFVRYLQPTDGGSGTLGFTGNGHVASVPIAAVTNPGGIGGQWRAAVSVGDIARDVAETFSGPAPVNVSITGLPALVVPASPEPRRVFAECLG